MASIVTVEFAAATQSVAALEAAAYRLIGVATCLIEQEGGRLLCQLSARADPLKKEGTSLEELKARFIDLVIDENLRERIASRTEGVRNVILSLAFGSLISQADGNH